MMTNDEAAQKILEAISGSRFEKWYNEGGKFDNFICLNNPPFPTKEEIIKDIISIFHLKD